MQGKKNPGFKEKYIKQKICHSNKSFYSMFKTTKQTD